MLLLCPDMVVAQPYEFRFWTSSTTKADPRVVDVVSHPCGEVAEARVNALPRYSKNGSLIPERVFELGAEGKILRLWSMPVDSVPYALDGDSLLFAAGSQIYRVDTVGKVAEIVNPPTRVDPTPVKCKIPQTLLPSAYATCEQFTDLATGAKRVLSYEAVCS
jgi:hypothetical protein